RFRQVLEGVRLPQGAVDGAVGMKERPNAAAGTTSPAAGLVDVSGKRSPVYVLRAELHVLKAADSDHRIRLVRPVQSVLPCFRVEWEALDDFQVERTKQPVDCPAGSLTPWVHRAERPVFLGGNGAGQGLLDDIEVPVDVGVRR